MTLCGQALTGGEGGYRDPREIKGRAEACMLVRRAEFLLGVKSVYNGKAFAVEPPGSIKHAAD